MSTDAAAATVRTSIEVEAPIERAFRVFTDEFGTFKPPEHNLLQAELAETPDHTRVELEHRNLDRHGAGWEGVREGVAGDDGWPLYLRRYADRVTQGR